MTSITIPRVLVVGVCLLLSACSSGKDRLEAIGVVVTEQLHNVKTETGFEMRQLRSIDVGQEVELEEFFRVLPTAKHVTLIRMLNRELTCQHVAALANVGEIETLVFDNCAFDHSCLEALANAETLQRLSVIKTPVKSDAFAFLKSLPRLTTVTFVESQVDDSIADTLLACEELRYVILSKSNVSDAFVAATSQLPKLRRLYLDETAVTASGLGPLAGSRTLERLHVAHIPYDDSVGALIQQLPRLKAIVLDVSEAEAQNLSNKLPVVVLPPSRAHQDLDD